ncbi:Aldo/keto reductase family-domain-containing protein [Aspergillus undulatus]|uniref:Aldo/keto reductase family-domain-containing protein n=1 Tax=Aspergillus undulatus TaxID=1810928 RepID=UPI003CCD9EC1
MAARPSTPLSQVLPPLILGGAGFSYQLTSSPNPENTRKVLLRAFDLGIRAIDTSPYYEPSEKLLGESLSHAEFTKLYMRDDYLLITKVGRVSATKSDYSPEWIRYSVARSLERLRTSYLDVVFCHDIELVPEEDVLEAIGVLWEMVAAGTVRYVGISGYPIDTLARVARRAREIYGRPLDVIQNWAQMTLQNDRLEREGLKAFAEAGISSVCSSSPLASGLLRDEGVPIAALGDWHPAPDGLRRAVQAAAVYVASQGESLARLAVQYALQRAQHCSTADFRVGTILGGTSVAEVEENINTAARVLQQSDGMWRWTNKDQGLGPVTSKEDITTDSRLFSAVHRILGAWKDYSFGDEKSQVEEAVVQTKL